MEFKATWPLNILNTAYSLIKEGSIIDITTGEILKGNLNNHSLVEVIGEYPSIAAINVHEMASRINKFEGDFLVLGSRKEKNIYTFALFKYEA